MPTERTTLLGTHCHPCPLSCPLGISSGLRARTVSATRGAEGEAGRCPECPLPPDLLDLREGLAPQVFSSPPPPPVISSALHPTPPLSPDLSLPSLPRREASAGPPGGDRCSGRWRTALRGPAPGASLGAPGPVGRAGGSRGGGAGRGAVRGPPGAPLAGRVRARGPFLPRRRAPAPSPPPPARAGSRPLRVLSRVSPRPPTDSPLLSFLPLFLLSPHCLKMPSATSHSGSGSKSSGPPPPSGSSGNEAGAGAAAPASQHPTTGTGAVQTEAMKQILGVIDKKLRNLEKKKVPGAGGEGRVWCSDPDLPQALLPVLDSSPSPRPGLRS